MKVQGKQGKPEFLVEVRDFLPLACFSRGRLLPNSCSLTCTLSAISFSRPIFSSADKPQVCSLPVLLAELGRESHCILTCSFLCARPLCVSSSYRDTSPLG